MGDVRRVKWRAGWQESEFLSAVERAGGLVPGAVVHLAYAHDRKCPRHEGGGCRCDPDVTAYVTPGPGAVAGVA